MSKAHSISKLLTSTPTGSASKEVRVTGRRERERLARQTLVANGMPVFAAMEGSVNTLTSVPDVCSQDMCLPNVGRIEAAASRVSGGEEGTLGLPRYRRGMGWGQEEADGCGSKTVAWTENEPPLPGPGRDEFLNDAAVKTIESHPELFRIVSPVKHEVLRQLCTAHPNQPFVESVCEGFRKGFWPWATTGHNDGYPEIWDNSWMPPRTCEERDFLHGQRDVEMSKGYFSPSFGPDLLPGMYSSPIHAVPKPRSDKFRLVVNQSAGRYAPNSMIARESIMGAPLDSIQLLGAALLAYRRRHGASVKLRMFKSDISGAYRLCPMHPLWQIKQVITTNLPTVDEVEKGTKFTLMRNVDRNNAFGNRSGGRVFISFNALVTWIARNVENISDLFTYVDDDYGFQPDQEFEFYALYEEWYPSNQTKLLLLWDCLGISHDKPKQVHGLVLAIIGFDVDPNAMSATMSSDSKSELVAALRDFVKARRHTLHCFQQIAGWSNWSFNVHPLLKPGLCHVYEKMKGKSKPHAEVAVSKGVKDDLEWLADRLEASNGIFFFESLLWSEEDADVVIFCDACLEGLGFWIPERQLGFWSPCPPSSSSSRIFYFEALCTVSALHHVICIASHYDSRTAVRWVVIYSDSLNSVQMFNSLRALPEYNTLLRFTVDILMEDKVDLRVLHVPGTDNQIADALSQFDFMRFHELAPNAALSTFQPPHEALGVAKK